MRYATEHYNPQQSLHHCHYTSSITADLYQDELLIRDVIFRSMCHTLGNIGLPVSSKQETFTQRCFTVGPTSATMAQQLNNVGCMCRVYPPILAT